ncbi:unnamed protein product [Prunus armeniaca]
MMWCWSRGLSHGAERKNDGWSRGESHGAAKVLGRNLSSGKQRLPRRRGVTVLWRLGSVVDWIIMTVLLLVLLLLARVIQKALVERKKRMSKRIPLI